MKRNYDTLVEAINDLKSRGYVEDFNRKENCLECKSNSLNITPKEFVVDEMYRFEGESNPADSSIVYAIVSEKHGLKGVLVDAFGIYADPATSEMIEKLRYRPGH